MGLPPATDQRPNRFDKLIQVLVPGTAYERISDNTCSATTIRRRRDEWIEAGISPALEQIFLEA